MQALATPRQPSHHERAPPLSLRSRAGRVTPLPDLDFVELGRQGILSGSITSPRVSRRQATLFRSPDGALRVVSQGANPTAVVTRAGAVVRCVEINKCVGCTRQFFPKSFLGDDAADLARSSGEEPASPRHRAGVASMAWRTTR